MLFVSVTPQTICRTDIIACKITRGVFAICVIAISSIYFAPLLGKGDISNGRNSRIISFSRDSIMSRNDYSIIFRIVLILLPVFTIVWIILILIELVLRTRDIGQRSLITCAISQLGCHQILMLIAGITQY